MGETIADFNRAKPARSMPPAELARALGWFSGALGAVELAAPCALTRLLGLRGHETVARSYFLRETGTGEKVLSSNAPTDWVWGRVGGDALDIATVALGFGGPRRANAALALVSLLG